MQRKMMISWVKWLYIAPFSTFNLFFRVTQEVNQYYKVLGSCQDLQLTYLNHISTRKTRNSILIEHIRVPFSGSTISLEDLFAYSR